jgi:hypothetical protein
VRRGRKRREKPLEKRPDLADVSEGERCGDERRRLDILPGAVPMGELDGV